MAGNIHPKVMDYNKVLKDDLEKIFARSLQSPPDGSIENDYTNLYVTTLKSFTKIIGRSNPVQALALAHKLCEMVMTRGILKYPQKDAYTHAAITFLTNVASTGVLNHPEKEKTKEFWIKYMNERLNSEIHVISSEVTKDIYIESKKSVQLFYSKLDAL